MKTKGANNPVQEVITVNLFEPGIGLEQAQVVGFLIIRPSGLDRRVESADTRDPQSFGLSLTHLIVFKQGQLGEAFDRLPRCLAGMI